MSKPIAQTALTLVDEGGHLAESSDLPDRSSYSETFQTMRDAAPGRNLSGPFDTTEEMWAAILEDVEE